MTMTMDELMKVLDMQEDILQFTHFTNADAWELGTMILMEARRRGAQVGIMIRRSNGEVVFQFSDLRGRSRRCGNRSSVRHGTGFGS